MGRKDYLVILNTVHSARGPELERALADAALRATREADRHSDRPIPLPIVAAPALTEKMLDRLQVYAESHLPPEVADWGAFDLSGSWRFPGFSKGHSPADADVRDPPSATVRKQSPTPNPFTDLGQWLAKVLLAEHVDASSLQAPRGPFRNLAQLAAAAEVSLPTASRWAGAMHKEKYLADGPRGISAVRVHELLNRWANAVHGRQYEDYWAEPVLASTADRERLARQLAGAGTQGVLLGDEACRRLGVSVVFGAPMQLALPVIDAGVLEDAGLRLAVPDARHAILLRRPRFPEALRRGAVERDGVQVADVLQCAIDARHGHARGLEQYDAIVRHLGVRG